MVQSLHDKLASEQVRLVSEGTRAQIAQLDLRLTSGSVHGSYCSNIEQVSLTHRLNEELDPQSLFELHFQCTQLYSLAETPQPSPLPPHSPAFGLIYSTRALLVSQDRRHLFVMS
jgi:hypothetical protein